FKIGVVLERAKCSTTEILINLAVRTSVASFERYGHHNKVAKITINEFLHFPRYAIALLAVLRGLCRLLQQNRGRNGLANGPGRKKSNRILGFNRLIVCAFRGAIPVYLPLVTTNAHRGTRWRRVGGRIHQL